MNEIYSALAKVLILKEDSIIKEFLECCIYESVGAYLALYLKSL